MTRSTLAENIIHACLEMSRLGLNQGTAGNISVRYQEGMLITPSGIAYEKMNAGQIVYVNASGESEEGKIPSSEWRFHQAAGFVE